jgi:Spy/CpxP family protein refolding chaperone
MRIIPAAILAVALVSQVTAQQPKADEPAKKDQKDQKDYSTSSIVVKMMAFNKKKDGKLTKEEVTDTRLHRLFDLADANKDGVVTKEELMALAAKLEAEEGQGGGRGPGGPGGDRGPGGPGGPGGRGPGGPPPIGQVMPDFVQEALKLKDDQKKQVADLQKDVDTKVAKILTDDQNKQLKEMKDNPGRGGPGGRGGDRGPGGPGGDRGPGVPGGDRAPGGDRGPGGRGPGGRGPGGPPALGQVMPDFVQEALKLKDDQKKQVADLQKDVDTKVAKILTDDQNKQLKEMKDNPGRGGPGGDRGPGGPGGDRGPGGPGGDRGPGGRGPGGEGRP